MKNIILALLLFISAVQADNYTFKDATGTTHSAGSDTISSVDYNRFKLITGADGTNGGDVTSGNPFPVTIVSGASSGTEYTEDAAAAADPVGTVPVLVRKDTPATITSTDGDNVAQRGTNYGAAYVQILTSSGAYVDSFGGGTQYTEDSASANGDTMTMCGAVRRDTRADNVTTDGDRTQIHTDADGRLWVNADGAVAHDGVSTERPRITGSVARTSDVTAVANNDVAEAISDLFGKRIVLPYSLPENSFTICSASDITNTTSTAVKTASGAGVRAYITSLTISNMDATVATRVDILDGSTVIWTCPAASLGGGCSVSFPTPLRGTANTAVNAQAAVTSAEVRVCVSGFTAAN